MQTQIQLTQTHVLLWQIQVIWMEEARTDPLNRYRDPFY
jgi:hypothetical protein